MRTFNELQQELQRTGCSPKAAQLMQQLHEELLQQDLPTRVQRKPSWLDKLLLPSAMDFPALIFVALCVLATFGITLACVLHD